MPGAECRPWVEAVDRVATYSALFAVTLALASVAVVDSGAQPGPTATGPILASASLVLEKPGELVATVTARCDMCRWDVEGREAVVLSIWLDEGYSQHLPLVRTGSADYRVLVGAAGAGTHMISVRAEPGLSARALGPDAATVERVELNGVLEDSHEHIALALAPFVYARPNTVGRFSDVPALMWYEVEPTSRGTRYRYSVIFSNEDGGTPADRLMATWGRTTDIEYLYSVEIDHDESLLEDDYQGPEHKVLPFRGEREGRHPQLWVSTDNNMVLDKGATSVRYLPAPIAFELRGVSREAVMDAHPWLYELMAQELAREGKIVADARAGSGTIPDPRRFVYVEACGTLGGHALAFAIRTGNAWVRSDRGERDYRITRDGCFRAATPLPTTAGCRVSALRVMAFEPPATQGSPGASTQPVRLMSITRVFMLDERYVPQAPLLTWQGPATLRPGEAPLEIPIP